MPMYNQPIYVQDRPATVITQASRSYDLSTPATYTSHWEPYDSREDKQIDNNYIERDTKPRKIVNLDYYKTV